MQSFTSQTPTLSSIPLAEHWQTALVSALILWLGAHGLAKLARKYIWVPKYTIMDDLPNFGKARTGGTLGSRAVICGGSFGGLFAAAMCSFHFDSVVIIEPESTASDQSIDKHKSHEVRIAADGLQRAIPLRTRVVQYLASHIFLPVTLKFMRQMFPKLDDELKYFGVSTIPNVVEGYQGSVELIKPYTATDKGAVHIFPTSRALFETLVRRLVFTYRANVTFIQGTVDKFERSKEDPTRLSGVSFKSPRGDRFEKASFIVDATGVAQVSYNKLLKSAGFGNSLPTKIEYEPHLNYSQTVWALPPDLIPGLTEIIPAGMKGTFYANLPDWSTGENRACYISFYDNTSLCIAFGALGGNEKPHTIPEIRVTIQSLHGDGSPPEFIGRILDFLEEHEDDCIPWIYDANTGKMHNIPYHEAPEALPSNWVAIGDAVTKLNPIYGQGTTKAAIEVVTLDSILRAIPAAQGIPADLPERYYTKRAPRVLGLWEATKASDYSYATTQPGKGETNETGAHIRKLGLKMVEAGCQDLALARSFYNVQVCLAPPTDLLAPSIVAKVARKWILG
ncbi:hypothetical protein FRB93_008679 [Tulasnella sp. JGI-2019a]|nr:hypothetical protein FRB93_008679 [Tulasnella sp. JGI-2019a]